MDQEESRDHLVFDKEKRTIMDCHECGKQFVALLDYGINGNHIIHCPNCGHEHCRVIEQGKITGERWSSRYGSDKERYGKKARRVWTHNNLPMQTTTASEFMRQLWLDNLDI
jgi:hypothetical protein